ncbi:phosphatidylserine/phosphatidylglycerophosphate/cardiolipin synthase family protein [Bdellovibrio bacteriovorus]
MKNSRYLLVFSALILSACHSLERKPAALFHMPPSLEKLYENELALLDSQEKLRLAQKSLSQSEDDWAQNVADLKKKKFKLEAQAMGLTAQSAHGDAPKTFETLMLRPWGVKNEAYTLADLSYYEKSAKTPFFSMSNHNAENYELLLRHEVFYKQTGGVPTRTEETPEAQKYLEATLKCDGSFSLKSGVFKFDHYKSQELAKFHWYDGNLNGQKVRFRPSNEVRNCQLTFKNPWGDTRKEYAVQFKTEKEKLGFLETLAKNYEACVLPSTQGLKKTQSFFLNSNYGYMNCPLEAEKIITLEEAEDGLQAKAEMLLGQRLPAKFLADKNPFAPLDFSKAPKLDGIFVSYLVFRSDFYGNILARLMKYHADRGTQVRMLISDVISLDKDKILFEKLMAENGNIKAMLYRYDNDSKSGGKFHELHRTNHVKIFLTLSSSDPKANKVVLGGRNIHDGFLLRTVPNHSKYPSLINYPKDEAFVHWRDFEFTVESKEFTEKVASQFYSLWMQDTDSFHVRPTTVQLSSPNRLTSKYFETANEKPLVRHYLSIPYKDNQTLEDFYADLIDSAQKKVLISTPYFRPLKKVGDALQRAADRGVQVTLLTRLDLKGDTADLILSAVNKDGVNRFKDTFKVYEYTEPKIILHSKLIMIDDELSFLGSVNLNKRSFIHDMENGALIYSPALAKRMENIYKVYLQQSRPITEKQKVWLWQKLVIGIFDSEF